MLKTLTYTFVEKSNETQETYVINGEQCKFKLHSEFEKIIDNKTVFYKLLQQFFGWLFS